MARWYINRTDKNTGEVVQLNIMGENKKEAERIAEQCKMQAMRKGWPYNYKPTNKRLK